MDTPRPDSDKAPVEVRDVRLKPERRQIDPRFKSIHGGPDFYHEVDGTVLVEVESRSLQRRIEGIVTMADPETDSCLVTYWKDGQHYNKWVAPEMVIPPLRIVKPQKDRVERAIDTERDIYNAKLKEGVPMYVTAGQAFVYSDARGMKNVRRLRKTIPVKVESKSQQKIMDATVDTVSEDGLSCRVDYIGTPGTKWVSVNSVIPPLKVLLQSSGEDSKGNTSAQ